MAGLPKRVALVYDRVNKWGGAERVLLALHEVFPRAPLYTSVYSPLTAPWAKVFPAIVPSYLQRVPFFRKHHELIPFLMPAAFEQFDFTNFDLVISVTSEAAKGVVTKPGTTHLCYCLTPTRYLYSHRQTYLSNPIFRLVAKYLRFWDQIAATRPDGYIAISQTVRARILNYYRLPAKVVYPGVDTDFFVPVATPRADYFLVVGRLVGYKNINQIISVFNLLAVNLVIVGSGNLKLGKVNANIKLAGLVSDEKLREYYQHSRALIIFHEEDFGLVSLEAQACGRPVIALNVGGATETVVPNITGITLDSVLQLPDALVGFNTAAFDSVRIRDHALRFSKAIFKARFLQTVSELLNLKK